MRAYLFSYFSTLMAIKLRGDAGVAYIVLIMILLIFFAANLVGGVPKFKNPTGSVSVQVPTVDDQSSTQSQVSRPVSTSTPTVKLSPTLTPTPGI